MSGALARLLESTPTLSSRLDEFERAARADAPILILGEAGCGRSSLARALHDDSRRGAGALVEVDVAAIPATLFESELFGYRPGAFTGADRVHPGRVSRAEGGTLLLDHLEELPVAAQPKLLRLLAERRYSPLGGGDTAADVRFVTVAAGDLPARVESGAFREDLYWRLEVLTVRLPPLRERRDDIVPLAEAMLADLGLRFGRPRVRLAAAARGWLPEQAWPGNLRQLRNSLERALLASDRDAIEPERPRGVGGAAPGRSLEQAEIEAIRSALAETRGHQGRAATLLGISRKNLWEKRKRYGLP